ncbi:MAG: sigma-70 family RNA polymerase sigma factor [Myxococcota bacterium]
MDSTPQREAVDAAVRQACEASDPAAATRRVLEAYGPELLGYLVAITHQEDLANEAFSVFCEHLWRGLSGFRWESSLRTWCYVIARNALHTVRRSSRRHRRLVPLSDAGVADVAAQLRSTTALHLKTEVKDAVARLRQKLPAKDQDILVLRLGRKMSWLDIARVMHDADAPEPATLKREAARLRKRFERAKSALKILIREHGLDLAPDDDRSSG